MVQPGMGVARVGLVQNLHYTLIHTEWIGACVLYRSHDIFYISGFPKIVNILSGQAVTDENYRHLLDVFADEVINRIDPTDLISDLVKYEVSVHEMQKM